MSIEAGPQLEQRHLMALLDHTSAVIYMRGLDGRYLLVNGEFERLFSVRRDDIIGLTDHDLFPKGVADVFRANDLAAIAEGRPVEIEETAPSSDGDRTYVTVKFPLRDNTGAPYAICGISTDITARKKAEQEIIRLNEELEERVRHRTAELEASTNELDAFAYSVSHDLRAPLRSLSGYSELILEDFADRLDETGKGYLLRIEANANRMSRMIDDLLDLSRTTRAALHRQTVDLSSLADEVIEELREQNPERPAQVTVAMGMTTEGDPHLIRLVLHNLLANAWKFTAVREPAVIDVVEDSPGVVTIRDNGAGFDMRYAAKLFDPFQRLHSAAEFDGSGIGLAIVHRIVQRHGGRIWATGEVGHGASFSFTLTSADQAEVHP